MNQSATLKEIQLKIPKLYVFTKNIDFQIPETFSVGI